MSITPFQQHVKTDVSNHFSVNLQTINFSNAKPALIFNMDKGSNRVSDEQYFTLISWNLICSTQLVGVGGTISPNLLDLFEAIC